MKYYILSFFLIITIGFDLYSQNLRNPVDNTGNGLSNLYSDWGPRNFTGGSRFHAGLDYSPLPNGVANALEGGTPLVFTFTSTTPNNSYITVGNWIYRHVLIGNATNWTLKNPADEFHVQLETIGANGLTKIFVDTNDPEFLGAIRWPRWNPDLSVITTQTVIANDIVFRPNGGNHLHLETNINGNWVNPLAYIAYNGSNSNNMTLDLRMKYNNGGIATVFPTYNQKPNVIYGEQVIVESDVNYVGEYDLNVTQVEAQQVGGNYATIAEWIYSSTNSNHVTLDRSTGVSNVPYYNSYPQGSEGIRSEGTILADPREGLHPVLTGGNNTGRDIFKRHWNTKQGWNTSTPAYPDGEYTLRLTTEDIRGNACDNPVTQTKIIDNFRPYIKKVEVRTDNANNTLVYEGKWDWQSGSLIFSTPTNIEFTERTPLVIHIYPSEPMLNMNITAYGLSPQNESSSNPEHWIFKIPQNLVGYGENIIQINSNSQDLAANNLWGMSSTSPIQSSLVPLRNSFGNWSNTSTNNDVIHKLNSRKIPETLSANFTASTTTDTNGTSIQFTSTSTGSPTIYNWSFPGGTPSSSNSQNPIVTYNTPGTYNVSLTVSNGTLSDTETKLNFITITMSLYTITGIVKSTSNWAPISGVSVVYTPKTNSPSEESGTTITGANGSFSISVGSGWTGSIRFSKDGFGTITNPSVGPVTGNLNLQEIYLTPAQFSFTWEQNETTTNRIDFDIQKTVQYHYVIINWNDNPFEPGNDNFQTVSWGVPIDHYYQYCNAGNTCSSIVEMCFYDNQNDLLGCCSGEVSFFYEADDQTCVNVDIEAAYILPGGANVFPIGYPVTFSNISTPQNCILSSTWFFDNDHSWDDCSWWDQNFNCNARCKYDKVQLNNCTGASNNGWTINHEYDSKGKKVIRLFVTSECDEKANLALGCKSVSFYRRTDEVFGGVIITDCDESVRYSNNLSDAVVDESQNRIQYYAGQFYLDQNINLPSNNLPNVEFIGCSRIVMEAGYKASASSNQSIRMYLHPNLASGNQKSVLIPEYTMVEANYALTGTSKLNKSSFILYPNPVYDIFRLNMREANISGLTLHIVNTLGQELKCFTEITGKEQFDISLLIKGVYHVLLKNKGITIAREKIIKL